MSAPPREIERTWLLSRLPALPPHAQRHELEQGYLPDPAPGAGAAERGELEGRLRRAVGPDGRVKCTHTIKRGSGLVREEVEREISEAELLREWPRTAGRRLSKVRWKVREGEHVWEVDEFPELGLVLCEVELADERESPTPPPWLAPWLVRDVTEDPRFRNYALATRGRPE